MRLKAEAILEFGPADGESQNKIVRQYREEYKTLSEILDQHAKILEIVHRDLGQLSNSTSPRGRKATFTSENLFRAILVMQREGLDDREASVRIAESDTLQQFCRLLKKPTLDFTLPGKCRLEENSIRSVVSGDSIRKRSRIDTCSSRDIPTARTTGGSVRSAQS